MNGDAELRMTKIKGTARATQGGRESQDGTATSAKPTIGGRTLASNRGFSSAC